MTLLRRSSWPPDMGWTEDLFDRMFRDTFRDFFAGAEARLHPLHLEEYVENDTAVIRAEMPGIDPDKDVEISVANGMLHVRAHREERKKEDLPQGYRSEFHYGSFERSIRLPDGVSEADVKATYKDGILEVRIPMPAAKVEPEPAHIPIEHG